MVDKKKGNVIQLKELEKQSQGWGTNPRVFLVSTAAEMIRLCDIYKERAVQEGRELKQGDLRLLVLEEETRIAEMMAEKNIVLFTKARNKRDYLGGRS